MTTVVLLEESRCKVRLGIQGSSDEVRALLTASTEMIYYYIAQNPYGTQNATSRLQRVIS